MKPRVFISSTYYDLKHVRERLERFIENYYFEPVLFESDNVLFEHGKELDESCYSEVELSHMMVLIVGGRYGSAVSEENSENDKNIYKKFTSITQKEFLTARKENIPIFIFVEKNVHAEYKLYSKNKDFFDRKSEDGKKQDFNLFHVDDVNVHRFIDSLQSLPIKTFDKIEDIETYLGNQFAGMFYSHLEHLREKQNDKEILDSVAELKTISKSMNAMIDAVGKNLLQDTESYEQVIKQQNTLLMDYFVKSFFNDIEFNNYPELSEKQIDDFITAFDTHIFSNNFISIEQSSSFEEWESAMKEAIHELMFSINKLEPRVLPNRISFASIMQNYEKLQPLFNQNSELKSLLIHRIRVRMRTMFSGTYLPL